MITSKNGFMAVDDRELLNTFSSLDHMKNDVLIGTGPESSNIYDYERIFLGLR